MKQRTPQSTLETLFAVLAEHGLRAVLIVPSSTSRGRQFLQVLTCSYTSPEVDAILKEALRCGETLQEAEDYDAAQAEDAEDAE